MKKIKLAITKCINGKCGFNIISEPVKTKCPICGNKMITDKNYDVTGFDDKDTDEAFIGFKKIYRKGKNGYNNRPRKTKNKK